MRSGAIAALLYNANRDPKKDPEGKAWWHFNPNVEAPQPDVPPEPDEADDEALSENFWQLMNATFNRKDRTQ